MNMVSTAFIGYVTRNESPLSTLEPRVRSSEECPIHTCEFDWGNLHYRFTPFDIIYVAVDKNGKVIKNESLEFPIENERDSGETVELVGRRIATLVKQSK